MSSSPGQDFDDMIAKPRLVSTNICPSPSKLWWHVGPQLALQEDVTGCLILAQAV